MPSLEPDFDFSSDAVLSALIDATRERPSIKYVGSATSHFQAEPLSDESSEPVFLSDWEFELSKNLRRMRHSGIHAAQKRIELPHFLRLREKYIARSKGLGENMFRFSIDFARLCPSRNTFNEKLMEEYVRTLALIRLAGQEPMLTLEHFTMPMFLTGTDAHGRIRSGGWEHPEALAQFEFYVRSVAAFLSDKDRLHKALEPVCPGAETRERIIAEGLVRHFVTLNEPGVILMNSYLVGVYPPYARGALLRAEKTYRTLVRAHDIASDALRSLRGLSGSARKTHIGVGYSWQYFDGPLGSLAHALVNELLTRRIERDGTHSDFLDLHYYFRLSFPYLLWRPKGRDYSNDPHFGDVYPKGLLLMAKKMHALYPDKEMFVSEFGFAAEHDRRRPFWLLETVRFAIEAKQQGIPIRGLLLWSLVDNFEWEFGMQQRFGLFSERELMLPLSPEMHTLRSWQAWSAVAEALTHPSKESLAKLQTVYARSKLQYRTWKAVTEAGEKRSETR